VSPEPRDRAQEPDDGASLVYEETLVLVGAAQKGDRNALESLFERYLPRVRRTAALRTGRRLNQFVEFDDIAQDALIKVFQGLDRFEQKFEGSFRNWLANCVQCEIADQARRAVAKKRGGGKVRRFGDCASAIAPRKFSCRRSLLATRNRRAKSFKFVNWASSSRACSLTCRSTRVR
jgi:hypothetical protein